MAFRYHVAIILIFIGAVLSYPQKKFLFDNTKAETAGNADWVIDEDNNTAGRFPTPDQSNITQTTAENYWTGAISSWGIALVKLGYKVETLPAGSTITYGTSNPQDLINYDVFVIDEPNIRFSTSEKTALVNFVNNGGGLFMISDHNNSDRTNDGWDSPKIWNDLFTSNGVASDPFGMSVDLVSFSQTSTNIASGDTLLNGSGGIVTAMKWSSGASLTLNPSHNSSVKGVVWKTGSAQGNSNLLVARATYGNGRVVLVGDSSPADDGTGAPGNTLYVGWADPSVNGSHSALHINASIWLAGPSNVTSINSGKEIPNNFELYQNYPNPFNPNTVIRFQIPEKDFVSIKVFNTLGQEITTLVNEEKPAGTYEVTFNGNTLGSGIYFYQMKTGNFVSTKKFTLIK